MALGEKYRVYVDHQFGGDDRYLKLFKEGYSGSVSEPVGGNIPALLEYPGSDNDIFDPIFGSELTATLLNLTDGQYNEFATAKNRQWLAQVYNDTLSLVEWQGWLIPQEYEEPYIQPPYETSLIFNCGLGLLDEVDFLDTDGSYYTGRASEISILAKIMQKIYPTTLAAGFKPSFYVAVGLWETGQSASIGTGVMDQTYIDQNKYINEDGSVKSCLEVVREIVGSYRARISMGYLGWTIIRIRDLALFYDEYDIHHVDYLSTGVYANNNKFQKSTFTKTVTGAKADRSTMVGWMGSNQILRHERAYKFIRILQKYLYKNIIKDGAFKLANWDDFWSTSGTVTRVQSSDDLDSYAIKLDPAAYIYQEFYVDGTSTSPSQLLKLSFEAMVEHDNAYTTIAFGLYMTRDTGSLFQYLVGQIGGSSPSNPGWQTGSGYTYFTDEDGLPESGDWQRYELNIPYFPSDVDVHFRLIYVATAGSGTINGVYYRNVQLLGTYDGEPPGKENVLEQLISTDNIMEMPEETIELADIVEQGNEGLYFSGAKTNDSPGDVPTENWYSYRYNSGSRTRVGPTTTLADYILEALIAQHGVNRKRLTGQMNLNAVRWNNLVVEDNDILYLPTSLSCDLKRGEVDLSMVEIPETLEVITESEILSWTNNDFDTFTSDGEEITEIASSTAGQYADADDAISYKAYEKFRVSVQGTFEDNDFKITFAGYDLTLNDGDSFDIAPTSAGSSTPRLTLLVDGVGHGTMTDTIYKIERLYGY